MFRERWEGGERVGKGEIELDLDLSRGPRVPSYASVAVQNASKGDITACE